MNNSNFIRLSGWSFIIGAIALLPGAIGMLSWEGESTGSTPVTMQLAAFAVFLAPLLMVLGMLGLRARYKIGGGFLLFGAIVGGLLVTVGDLVQFFTPDYSVSETYYGVWLGGVVILNFCLLLFGFVALFEKPLPRWNWLPLAAGSWIVLLPILAGITGFQSSSVIIAGLVVMTILQIMLGYILQADLTEETKASQQGQPA
ncbi:MAG TPA: hypothetical protein VJ972_05835 [Anaerolineales bacterium]|nr:hypothetical protein [Anaerolineales bacterium]